MDKCESAETRKWTQSNNKVLKDGNRHVKILWVKNCKYADKKGEYKNM